MGSLAEKQRIFAHNVAHLIEYIYDKGFSCSLGEVFRTQEQAAIYEKEGRGIKDSLHCRRLAIDINLFSPDGILLKETLDYKFLGLYWEGLNPKNRWGGIFRRGDGGHFEMNDL